MSDEYAAFLQRKSQSNTLSGFAPLWVPDFLFDFQRMLVDWAIRKGRAAIFADCGLGKLHPVTEPVLTPLGWRPIGNLAVGDEVIGSAGTPVRIVGVFPQGVQEVVHVSFSDGAQSRCGWDHLWMVQSQNDRTRQRPYRVLTTRQLAQRGLRYGRGRTSRQWSIPLVAPIGPQTRTEGGRPVDSYALGVILGDGSITEAGYVSLTTDRAILAALGAARVRPHARTKWVGIWSTKSFADGLLLLGLDGCRSHEKFVPPSYLVASAADRLALLQGLMDTDGHALADGGTEFASTSESLVDGVVDLARSLGGIARKHGPRVTHYPNNGEQHAGKPSWRVNAKLPAGMCPFRVARKASAYVIPTKYQPLRLIDSITPEGIADESVCILVDAPDHLYVTRDYVVTHNTPCQLVWAENVVRHTGKRVLILTPLAVAPQTVREGEKFGVECHVSREGLLRSAITVTNYERLHYFDPADFIGVVCDESSAIKAFDGKRRKQVTDRKSVV